MLIIVVLLGLLFIFLAVTNPNNLVLGLLLTPFVLFGVITYHTIRLFMTLFRYMPGNEARQRTVALIFSVLFTNFAVLQSIGRLTVQDVVLALAITALVSLYVAKFQTS